MEAISDTEIIGNERWYNNTFNSVCCDVRSSLLVQCDATISSGNILLRATPETGVSGSTTYKINVRLCNVQIYSTVTSPEYWNTIHNALIVDSNEDVIPDRKVTLRYKRT